MTFIKVKGLHLSRQEKESERAGEAGCPGVRNSCHTVMRTRDRILAPKLKKKKKVRVVLHMLVIPALRGQTQKDLWSMLTASLLEKCTVQVQQETILPQRNKVESGRER